MADVFTPEKRSWVMSRIRGKNTKIEVRMRAMLRSAGIRFRQHPRMYGSPDFLVGGGTAVFCDGDFWHGYRYAERRPRLKRFWRDKIEGNMRRDRRVSRRLRRDGYSVVRLWEHDIEKRPDVCIRRITRFMRRGPAARSDGRRYRPARRAGQSPRRTRRAASRTRRRRGRSVRS
ncbi:MAG: very short patch repair endonuclease [Nitrosopumilus sp.]|nr:very short patch repair endonuclease [Nitrosopumilus sp.]